MKTSIVDLLENYDLVYHTFNFIDGTSITVAPFNNASSDLNNKVEVPIFVERLKVS